MTSVNWNVSCPKCDADEPSQSLHVCPVRAKHEDYSGCNCCHDCTPRCDGNLYAKLTKPKD